MARSKSHLSNVAPPDLFEPDYAPSFCATSQSGEFEPAQWAPLKATKVFDTYWRFACERQRIFFARLNGAMSPWTEDPVLLAHKFTNTYRASDRVSQYLIRNVVYHGDQSPIEVFFRTILFKFFNRIETWELLLKHFGEISFANYSYKYYDRVFGDAMAAGQRVYSAAYIMPSGGRGAAPGKKYQMHLRLLELMLAENVPERLIDAGSMENSFEILLSYPTIGEFLAYQYITDLNYSDMLDYSEMNFVCAGPGAKDGIRKCFSHTAGLSEPEIISLVAERQESEFDRLNLNFKNLWGRKLQLIDCQNVFCEVDKYSRVVHPEFSGISGRTRIKQRFSANSQPIPLWYPPKWGINEKLLKEI